VTFYRIAPEGAAPVLRQAGSIARATARGLQEFPAGLRSVQPVNLPELAAMATAGLPLPVSARQRLEVYQAVQREKAKADARVEAIRERRALLSVPSARRNGNGGRRRGGGEGQEGRREKARALAERRV
jgi:hypothetical protein